MQTESNSNFCSIRHCVCHSGPPLLILSSISVGSSSANANSPLSLLIDHWLILRCFQKNAADEKDRMSKRKLKKLSRLSVAELKQLVSRPDVVEMYDVTARDPKLLVQLKAHRNTVQVPRHWCYKRKVGSSSSSSE